MQLDEALETLKASGLICERRSTVVRYHLTEEKYASDILKNGLKANYERAGANTADSKTPGVWLAGSKDYIPVLRYMNTANKVLFKIEMPIDYYLSVEREYWPNGRMNKSVIASVGEHAYPSKEGRSYVEKFYGDIPAKYISLENDIGKNKKGDKQYIERLRYIVDEIGNLDSDEMTDKEVEDYIRRLPISIRLQKDIVPYTNIIKWAQGKLPIFED